MKGIDRLTVIRHISEKNNNWKHKDLFRILNKEDIWIAAYENIKSNKGALTPGSSTETIDGTSLIKLEDLRVKVVNESFKFNPVRKIEIKKPDGRTTALGLPTTSDKIVQEAIRMILEAIYEPWFIKESFGFRQRIGTHDALEHVEQRFRWVDWIVEGDIKSAYPTIDHNRLIEIMSKNIGDERFLNLIRKSLKCGILRNGQFSRSSLGVPQGSIVSPILANIYYHEMDKFIQNWIASLNEEPSTHRNKEYKHLSYRIEKLANKIHGLDKSTLEYKDLLKELKSLKRERQKTPSLSRKSVRIEYVRYADDWMIGIRGEKSLAIQLKNEIGNFLKVELKQTLHPEKTKITDIRAGKAKFLGYEIYLPREGNISPYTNSGTRTTRRTNPMLRLDIPTDFVLKRMEERGYVKRLTDKYFPTSLKIYTTLQDIVIVEHFHKVWRGIENYYSGCTNPNKLQYVNYLLRMSCAMTLAHRHRSSSSNIFRKFGKNLAVREGKKLVDLPVRNDWTLRNRKWLNKRKFADPFKIYASRVTRTSLNKVCVVCDSKEKIEMHHVKHVRKNGVRYGGFHKEMSLFNRKQVPLCKSCHIKVHQGLYDSIKLTNQTYSKFVSEEFLESRMQ